MQRVKLIGHCTSPDELLLSQVFRVKSESSDFALPWVIIKMMPSEGNLQSTTRSALHTAKFGDIKSVHSPLNAVFLIFCRSLNVKGNSIISQYPNIPCLLEVIRTCTYFLAEMCIIDV